MEIFNVHIFEFLLIAGLALVVFGPERLPEVGRFVGKQVARFLAWQQQSPELKMITDVRSEIEREIASLRDELVRTRNQLDLSRDADLKRLQDELRPMLNLRDPRPTVTAPQPRAEPAAALQPPPAAGSDLVAAEPPPAVEAAPEVAAPELPKTWDLPADPDLAPEPGLIDVAADAPLVAGEPEAGAQQPESDGFAGERPATGEPEASAQVAGEPEAIGPQPEAEGPSHYLLDPDDLGPLPPPAAPEGTVPATARPGRLSTQPTNIFDRPGERVAHLAERGQAPHDVPSAAELNGQAPAARPVAEAPAVGADEIQLILRRLEALSADVQTLISGLQAQGVIGADWEPAAAVAEQEATTR